MKGYRVPSTGVYLEGSGSGDAGMKIWKPVMQKYFQQIPRTGFSQPPRKIQVGRQVRVPSLNGLSIAAATRKLERRGFTVEKQYTYSDKVPKFGFIGWSPGPGSWVSEFGTIYAVYSNGRDPAEVAKEKARKKAAAKEEEAAATQPLRTSDVATGSVSFRSACLGPSLRPEREHVRRVCGSTFHEAAS